MMIFRIGPDKCDIIRISGPLKAIYAADHGLQLEELMSDSPYKETYRLDMIKWSDEIRAKNPGYFCKAACDNAFKKIVWIVSDVRRKSDIKWFKETYGSIVRTIRISATDDVRRQRGLVFKTGVDDEESECGLDDYKEWDHQVSNNNEDDCQIAINTIISIVEKF
ncbi:unnamed protein product [Acanthoscelides obtectus]|uniref:Phosphomevalonate kinase n=1 Tax=Acanthoscelides obtectus TaxID=200917 RepID=A0A9P0M688_ACAOB|nr:unnamed protein product [Acanthoscelides obtectus]CAK1630746.1 Phosphomevalonate kinase [Acanthoscelides obtectus]